MLHFHFPRRKQIFNNNVRLFYYPLSHMQSKRGKNTQNMFIKQQTEYQHRDCVHFSSPTWIFSFRGIVVGLGDRIVGCFIAFRFAEIVYAMRSTWMPLGEVYVEVLYLKRIWTWNCFANRSFRNFHRLLSSEALHPNLQTLFTSWRQISEFIQSFNKLLRLNQREGYDARIS